jgi:hypothetical protein
MCVLELGLPFSACENDWFRIATNTAYSRKTIGKQGTEVRVAVDREIKRQLSQCSEVSITTDEWTDCGMIQYLGVNAHAIVPPGDESGRAKYEVFCLAHHPLSDRSINANVLSETLTLIMEKFAITSKVRTVVSDTTNLMPATGRELHKEWSPCFGHIFNLMLLAILAEMKPWTQPIEDCVQPVSASTLWPKQVQKKVNKLVKHHRYVTIPTFTKTRWYSMGRLLENALHLRVQLTEFLLDLHKRKNSPLAQKLTDEVWQVALAIQTICATVEGAICLIEGDSFGTLSHVLEGLALFKESVVRIVPLDLDPEHRAVLPEWKKALITEWAGAMKKWNKYMYPITRPEPPVTKNKTRVVQGHLAAPTGSDPSTPVIPPGPGPHMDRVLLAAMLNPAVPQQILTEYWSRGQELLRKAHSAMKRECPSEISVLTDPVQVEPAPVLGARVSLSDLVLETPTSELVSFLAIDRLEKFNTEGFDVLHWWIGQRKQFPILWKLAQRYLTVPGTSASTERQFSQAKRCKPRFCFCLSAVRLQELVVAMMNRDITRLLFGRPMRGMRGNISLARPPGRRAEPINTRHGTNQANRFTHGARIAPLLHRQDASESAAERQDESRIFFPGSSNHTDTSDEPLRDTHSESD